MLSVGSAFTGIGGLDLGLERAGMRIVWQCEQDSYCRAVLARHWPDVPCYPDVRGVGVGRRDDGHADAERGGDAEGGDGCWGAIASVDLLCGGSPCQDVSNAGLRRGLAGERSGLFFEFARIADELVRPGGWIVFENVPGLLTSAGGRDFAVVLRTLGDIGFHDLAWRVLDSRYFGVPQRRRRVFIVARRAAGDSAQQVLLEPESSGRDSAQSDQARPRVAATLSRGSHGAGVSAPGRRQEDDENCIKERGGWRIGADEAAAGQIVVSTLKASDRGSHGMSGESAAGGHLQITHTLRAEGFDASEDGTGRGTPLTVVGTIRSHVRPGSNSDNAIVCPASDPDRDGAPSGLPRRVDDPLPDGPRYAACGNAVTVSVAEWIGRRIVTYEADRHAA